VLIWNECCVIAGANWRAKFDTAFETGALARLGKPSRSAAKKAARTRRRTT